MTTAFYTDQTIFILAALIILGITFLLKIITTVTLLIIAIRQKKSMTSLLGHPCIKNARKLSGPANCPAKKPLIDKPAHICDSK